MSGSGISWAICMSAPRSRQITMPVPHHSVFYRPDALPAAQPTASKHWRHAGQNKKNKKVISQKMLTSVRPRVKVERQCQWGQDELACHEFISRSKVISLTSYVRRTDRHIIQCCCISGLLTSSLVTAFLATLYSESGSINQGWVLPRPNSGEKR